MGCDVHLHIEVKINGKWEHYSHPRIQRDYGLFGIMAGVRGMGPAVVEPKGLPDDLSLITKLDYDFDGGDEYMHDESWFNREEIRQFIERANEFFSARNRGLWEFEHTQLGYANGNSFWSIGMEDSGHPKEYEDVRFVFWFDN